MDLQNALKETSDEGLSEPLQGPLVHGREMGQADFSDDPPLVSMIVRSMDRGTLDEALASLALQTYPNIEVIVVNAKGGGHHPLGDQCGRFPLSLVNQNGLPLPRSKAANMGLRACGGHYLGFLDDDDTIDRDHVQGLVDALLDIGDGIVVYAGARGLSRTDPGGAPLKIFSEPRVRFSNLVLGNVLPIHSVLFPASLLENEIRFDEHFECYEDWDFWLQLARVASFRFVDQMTAVYYMGGESAVSPMDPDEQAVLKARNALFAKWAPLLTPEEMGVIADSYHQSAYDSLTRCNYLESELRQYQGALQESQGALQESQGALQESQAALQESQAALQESQAALREKRIQLKDVLRGMQEAERIHLAEVDRLQLHVAGLCNSRSWKLTRPIRWSGRVARNTGALLYDTLKAFYSRLPLTLAQRLSIRCRLDRATTKRRAAEQGGIPVSVSVSPYTKLAMETAPAHILLIERWVPRPNQDAGSVMIFNFIRILRAMGYAMSFAPLDLVYDGEYTPEILHLGVECLHAPDIRSLEDHLVAEGSKYHIIIACRPDHTEALLPLFKDYCPQARLLYETIDLHFVREQRQAEIEQNPELLKFSKWRKAQELRIAATVDCTIVVSEQERNILHRENPDLYVEVIPVIEEIHGCRTGYDQRRDLIFIGGYEHLPNVDAVKYFVAEIFPLIVERVPDIRFLVVGSHPPETLLCLASENVLIKGFVPDITELMNNVRISVNPLRFGAGVKGKMVTSMSYGVPCVGTGIAVEGMGFVPGVQTLVADDPKAFAEEVIRLYTDRQLWERLSGESLAFVKKHFSLDVAAVAFERIFDRLRPGTSLGRLSLTRAVSYEAYLNHRVARELQRRQTIEQAYARDAGPINTKGFCFVCNREVMFHTDLSFSFTCTDGSVVPNWRERMVCPHCRLNNRMRAAIHLFHLLCNPTPGSRLYLTEQTTPLFQWYKNAYKDVTGSEFLGNTIRPGEINKAGLRNENLTALTFPDDHFDAILSFDVFEHIPDYQNALGECWRCLKAGGALFFSVPFDFGSQKHLVRAEIDATGQVRHLLPPEYHGDPINADGCLCFYHFGWELLDQLLRLGFRDASAYIYWSDHFGYLGGEQLVFRAVK